MKNLVSRMRSFANDEGGMEALQAVSLVAISAIIMIAVATGGNAASEWMQETWKNLTDAPEATTITGGAGGGNGGGLGGAARDAGSAIGDILGL